MIEITDGQIRFTAAPFDHRFAAAWRDGRSWRPLALRAEGDAFVAQDSGVQLKITMKPGADSIAYDASFTSSRPTRIRLALLLPGASNPFHLIPGIIHGDNNLGVVPPGSQPHLTTSRGASDDDPSCSTYWECRADRASHPVSAATWDGALAALMIQPYSDAQARVGDSGDRGFIRNGLFAQLASAGEPAACGATIGYANLPKTFHNTKNFSASTSHFTTGASASGVIYLRRAEDRRSIHPIIREIYTALRERPRPPISREQAARDVVRAFHEINWHGADGFNSTRTSSHTHSPFFGGKPVRNNFTNMRCDDEAKQRLVAWRSLADIGWAGGTVIGYPMLYAGLMFGDDLARQRGVYKLDRVAEGVKPESGMLYDVSGADEDEGKRLNWWWSAPPVMNCHCAYTNGSAVYYLMKSHRLMRDRGDGASSQKWFAAALSVLDTIVRIQLPDGNLGYTYRADRPEILDPDGFAGAWFLPGLAFAYAKTRDKKYLDCATRALAFYHKSMRDLCSWGTPMDCLKAIDSEGSIGFIRGAVELSNATGSREFLGAAHDGACYEYLFRYGFRTRPQYKPLRDSPWNSCGATMCTTAAGMTHPMGVYLARDLKRLAALSNDAYHSDRAEDGLDWAANSVAMYPEHTGYGVRGVMTERWVPSDGLTPETFPDGSPSSMWFSYNGWAAAAVLEGLIEDHAAR